LETNSFHPKIVFPLFQKCNRSTLGLTDIAHKQHPDSLMKKALIIFAKRPVAGKVKTRLIPALSAKEAAALYKCMLTDTITKVESLKEVDRFLFITGGAECSAFFHEFFPGMPILQQAGNDLGERMEAAFAAVFSMGYQAAAIIGTDSPDLPTTFIKEALLVLEEGRADAVFGPSEDGGYYLLAMRRLHNDLFAGIHWSTGQVLRQSLENAKKMGLRVVQLPTWHDVDTIEDLARPELRNSSNCAPLTRQYIISLLFTHGNREVKYPKGLEDL
jgi:rSAM/selenodomain-associated transferase 1